MATGTYSEVISENADLIRKGLDVAIFVAPITDTEEITALLDETSGQLDIPAAYEHVGMIEKGQGAAWSREVDSIDVESIGHAEPTRRDITTDVTGLEFIMQESKALTIELYEGISLASVVAESAGSTHSNVAYDKPDRPATRRFRVLALAKDGEGADAVYFAKWLPNAQVTDMADQEWNEDPEVQYQVTMTAFADQEFGTAMRNLWGIPNRLVEPMGFSDDDGDGDGDGGGVEG